MGVAMSADDLLFLIIIGGMVLSIVYLRAQYLMRRSYRIAERGNELRLRELYGIRPNTQGLLHGSPRPDSRAAPPLNSPNAVLHKCLPVHVRFTYRVPVALDGIERSTHV
jgi:hypothetical protein